MSKKTTIYDIAKELNITAATVSRALKNNPQISSSTCKLVAEKAAHMNYNPNKFALALQGGKSGNVGIIVPRIDITFFASIIQGIEEELHPQGYQVIICLTGEDEKKEAESIKSLFNAQIDGILMSFSKLTEENESIIRTIIDNGVPLIFFDRKKNIDGVSSVTINDFEGAYLATKNLINQGCTRIAHLSGNPAIEIYENRLKGYEQALLDHHIKFDENYIIQIKSSIDDGRQAAKKLLNLNPPPDGIFSSCDLAALGVIKKLREIKIKIPDDICVIGFGNEPFTEYMELSISSVDQSPLEMGKMTAKVFLEQINNPNNIKTEKKVVLTPKLQIRESSSRK